MPVVNRHRLSIYFIRYGDLKHFPCRRASDSGTTLKKRVEAFETKAVEALLAGRNGCLRMRIPITTISLGLRVENLGFQL